MIKAQPASHPIPRSPILFYTKVQISLWIENIKEQVVWLTITSSTIKETLSSTEALVALGLPPIGHLEHPISLVPHLQMRGISPTWLLASSPCL